VKKRRIPPIPAIVAALSAILISFCALADPAPTADEPKIKGKLVSEWIAQLRGPNRGLQLRAARALSAATPEQVPYVVSKLIPILESERQNDRFVAAQTLGNYGPAARAAMPKLVPLLKGTQFERNRACAAKALGLILKDAKPSEEVEKVTAALVAKFNEDKDQYVDVRREAVVALGMIGPAAKSCIPHLTPALRGRGSVAIQGAYVCERMGPLAAEHIDQLIVQLHRTGHDLPYAIAAVKAIASIGPVHENVIPNLVDFYEKHFWSRAALKAFSRFGSKSEPVVQVLMRLLDKCYVKRTRVDPPLAIDQLKTLEAIGPAAREAIPVVRALTKAKRVRGGAWEWQKKEMFEAVRAQAAKTLAAIEGKRKADREEKGKPTDGKK
jgi:HEAT repeat protein